MKSFWTRTHERDREELRRALQKIDLDDIINDGTFETKYPYKSRFALKKQCGECGAVHKNEDGERKYKAAMDAYRKENARKMELFRFAVIVENGLDPDMESSHVAFNSAWEEGHSAGLYEVANVMPGYASLVLTAKKDFQCQNCKSGSGK